MEAAQVLQSEEMFTLPLSLTQLQSNMTTKRGLCAAGSVLVSIPVIALFLTHPLVSGLTLGSVKG